MLLSHGFFCTKPGFKHNFYRTYPESPGLLLSSSSSLMNSSLRLCRASTIFQRVVICNFTHVKFQIMSLKILFYTCARSSLTEVCWSHPLALCLVPKSAMKSSLITRIWSRPAAKSSCWLPTTSSISLQRRTMNNLCLNRKKKWNYL